MKSTRRSRRRSRRSRRSRRRSRRSRRSKTTRGSIKLMKFKKWKHKDWLNGNTVSFQALWFTQNGKKRVLLFKSVKDREMYYQKNLKGTNAKQFIRGSSISGI